MIRRPPRSTLFPLHDALPIYGASAIADALRQRFDEIGAEPAVGDERHQGLRPAPALEKDPAQQRDRKSTRLNSSHANISYAVFCLKKKKRDTNLNSISLMRAY